MKVKYELSICDQCAYLFTYGEFNDGTEFADKALAYAEAAFGDELINLVIGEIEEGYSPIYTCQLHGEETEGEGRHSAVILEAE